MKASLLAGFIGQINCFRHKKSIKKIWIWLISTAFHTQGSRMFKNLVCRYNWLRSQWSSFHCDFLIYKLLSHLQLPAGFWFITEWKYWCFWLKWPFFLSSGEDFQEFTPSSTQCPFSRSHLLENHRYARPFQVWCSRSSQMALNFFHTNLKNAFMAVLTYAAVRVVYLRHTKKFVFRMQEQWCTSKNIQ